jgi:hypothetical protein
MVLAVHWSLLLLLLLLLGCWQLSGQLLLRLVQPTSPRFPASDEQRLLGSCCEATSGDSRCRALLFNNPSSPVQTSACSLRRCEAFV